ncbi:MAG: hypothetical protein M1817_003044 [Caeruleum heppii]|nr:MAG: hypothetical protein M1817_003044 [Caeruleum heppii]
MPPKASASSTADAQGAIYFHMPPPQPNGFLSQWHPAPFRTLSHPHHVFACAEQYMMYRKALLFHDAEAAEKILEAQQPKDMKRLGRSVRGFDKDVWGQERERIVEDGNWGKFTMEVGGTGERGLRRMLLETGDRELVEASPADRIWGVGFNAREAEANRERWGLNLLGKAIMRVRERIRNGEDKQNDVTENP